MKTTNKFPVEYVPSKEYSHFSNRYYEGQKVVAKRIEKAMKKGRVGYCRFEVKIVDMSRYSDVDKRMVTRVYLGSYGDKSMICSKQNQSIDIPTVLKAMRVIIRAKNKFNREYEVARDNRQVSEKSAERVNKALSLDYGTDFNFTYTSTVGKVLLDFKGFEISTADAENFGRQLQALTNKFSNK